MGVRGPPRGKLFLKFSIASRTSRCLRNKIATMPPKTIYATVTFQA